MGEAARLLALLEYNLDKFLHHALDIFACQLLLILFKDYTVLSGQNHQEPLDKAMREKFAVIVHLQLVLRHLLALADL